MQASGIDRSQKSDRWENNGSDTGKESKARERKIATSRTGEWRREEEGDRRVQLIGPGASCPRVLHPLSWESRPPQASLAFCCPLISAIIGFLALLLSPAGFSRLLHRSPTKLISIYPPVFLPVLPSTGAWYRIIVARIIEKTVGARKESERHNKIKEEGGGHVVNDPP